MPGQGKPLEWNRGLRNRAILSNNIPVSYRNPASVPGNWRRQAWEMTVFCDFTVFSILLQSAVLNLSASTSLEAGWKHSISGLMPDYRQSGAQVISWSVNTLKLRPSDRDEMWSDLIVLFCHLPFFPMQHCQHLVSSLLLSMLLRSSIYLSNVLFSRRQEEETLSQKDKIELWHLSDMVVACQSGEG